MPLPKPERDESQDEYVSRCMEWMHENESERPQKQQLAMCFSTWRDSKRSAVREVIIPIIRSFEKDGDRYVYGYGAVFDTPDELDTIISRQLVEENIPRLKMYPSLRFMHETPLGKIEFDKTVELPTGELVTTRIDDHGFHILGKVFKSCDKEWSMIQEGHWGLSYALASHGLVMGKRSVDGKVYDSFEHGKLYEFSVVDSPAHIGAEAGSVLVRVLNHSHKGGNVMTKDEQRYVPVGSVDEKLGTGGYACKVGDEWKLPIHDAAHVRNAMARYNQAEGCQTAEVKARICAAAKHFGIDNAFEKGGFCYKGEEREMDKEEEMEQWLKDAEERILKKVTDATNAKKTTVDLETSLKAMEERIMKAMEAKLAEKKEPSPVEKTFSDVQKKIEALDAKIVSLRKIEKSLKDAGEDYATLATRIGELEKNREDLATSIVKSVETAVERKLGEFNERLTTIENIPDLKSPATSEDKSTVRRGMGGFGEMLESARRGS